MLTQGGTPMPEKLRVGIIGAGMIAQDGHIPAYRKLGKEVEIAAIYAGHESSARAAAEKYKIPHWFTSAEEMLSTCSLDLVSICTPNMRHAADAALALQYGANVLCEKPLALTLKEAEDLFALAAEKGLMLEACQTLRFNAEYIAARGSVLDGSLGKVSFGDCTCVRRRGAPMRGAFLSSRLNGGGAFADIGVHFIDAILWIMGSPRILAVSGLSSANIIHGEKGIQYSAKDSGAYGGTVSVSADAESCDVEEFASGLIRLEGDASINFCIAWNANMPAMRSIRVLGDKSGLVLPELTYYGTGNGRMTDTKPTVFPLNQYADMPFPGHCYLIENAVAHLLRGEALIVKPEETLNVAAALELFYRSCAEGREVFRSEL